MNPMDGLEQLELLVDRFLLDYLFWIEWNYGEGRAPVYYPAKCSYDGRSYQCLVGVDDGGGEVILVVGTDPEEVLQSLKDEVFKRFGHSDYKSAIRVE